MTRGGGQVYLEVLYYVYWQAGNTMAQAAAPKKPGEAYRHVHDGSVYNRRFWFAIDYWAFVSETVYPGTVIFFFFF